MNVGMLWFDNDPAKGLDDKIERAAAYYRKKYGRQPTICFIHPSMFPTDNADESAQQKNNARAEAKIRVGGLEIRSNQSILPNHFWIGVNGIKDPSSR